MRNKFLAILADVGVAYVVAALIGMAARHHDVAHALLVLALVLFIAWYIEITHRGYPP